MKYRNASRKYRMPTMHMNANTMFNFGGGGDTGGGGGGASTGAGADKGAGGNDAVKGGGNDKGGGNTVDNLDAFGSLWDTDTADDDKGKVADANKGGHSAAPAPAATDFNKAFDEHVSGLNLTNGVDGREVLEAINKGDAGALQKAFSTLAANGYRAALLSADKLSQDRITKAMDEARNGALGSMRADTAVNMMNDKYPFTKHQAAAPLAKAMLAQMMQKHKGDTSKAVEETGNYFRAFFKHGGKDLGVNVAPQSRHGNNGRGGSMQNDADDSVEDVDWLSVLGRPQG